MPVINATVTLTPPQQVAWNGIMPTLQAHMPKLALAYKAADDETRRKLRLHNPVMAQILDLVKDYYG